MLIRRSAGCFKCDFRIFGILGNYFIMVGRHVMVLWWGYSPWFLCYQLDFLLDIFMRDRSDQGLKDATSFGLICGKSAEIRGLEYWKNCQFSIVADSAIFGFLLPLLVCKLADDDVTCMCKGYFRTRSVSASMENFQIIKYFESDYLAILSDNRANEVASCRYW